MNSIGTTGKLLRTGYPLQQVLGEMQIAGFEINKTFRVFEMPYHRFFVLLKDAEKARTNQGLIPEKLRVGEGDSGLRTLSKKEN